MSTTVFTKMTREAILFALSFLVIFVNGLEFGPNECLRCHTECSDGSRDARHYIPQLHPHPTEVISPASCQHGPEGLPIYSFYIMLTIMLFMFLVILSLTFIICRDKCSRKIFHHQESYVEFSKSQAYVRQDSNDVVPLKMPIGNNYNNDSTLTINTVAMDVVDMAVPMPQISQHTLVEGGVLRKPKKPLKKPTVKNILKQDTIEQIIRNTLQNNVLNESTSLKHLDQMCKEPAFNYKLHTDNETKELTKNMHHESDEKFASSPELELYDSLPTPRKLGDYEEEEIYSNEVYQYPKPLVEPVTEEEVYMEPSYINATRYKPKVYHDEIFPKK